MIFFNDFAYGGSLDCSPWTTHRIRSWCGTRRRTRLPLQGNTSDQAGRQAGV